MNARSGTPVVWLINGVPGAGKTTIAAALARRFPLALHIPADDLRDLVVSGRADPLGPPTDQVRLQFGLSWRAAAVIAATYAASGFTVVIDDLAPADAIAIYERHLVGHRLHKVLLAPAKDVALARNASRTSKSFDTAILEPVIHQFYEQLLAESAGALVVDNSVLTIDQTVDAILGRA